MFLLLFLIRFIHPYKMFLGLVAVGIAFVLFALAGNAGPQVSNFKRDHPLVSLAVFFICCYFIVYLLNGIVVFIFGILLPISGKPLLISIFHDHETKTFTVF